MTATRIGCIALALAGLLASGCAGHSRPLPLPATTPAITGADFAAHVRALSDPRTEGRATASPGEALAADYVAKAFERIGLAPAGDSGSFRHAFTYSAGIALGPVNALTTRWESLASEPTAGTAASGKPIPSGPTDLAVDADWRPLSFSKRGAIAAAPVVFAGYGVVAPAEGAQPGIDEYAGLDVAGRWVVVLRDLPTALPGERRQTLLRHASLRFKTMLARERGAVGILFVNGPASGFREPLAPLRFDAAQAGTSIAALALRADVLEDWLDHQETDLATLQARVDQDWNGKTAAEPTRFELAGLRLAAAIDLVTKRATSHNVLGRLQVGDRPSEETIMLGAHLDHLGRGGGTNTLARPEESGQIHAGADDNASGVAALLEIAERLAADRAAGLDLGRRDFVFAAWSGEELGLLGSDAWADRQIAPHAGAGGPVAYLNFDMVGRLEDALVIHGTGSSPDWSAAIEAAQPGFPSQIERNEDAYLPTDSTSFYTRGIPVLAAFTGVHAEYHTPRDRPELIDAEGGAAIAALFDRLARGIGRSARPPAFEARPLPARREHRGGLRVFVGTIPDYARSDEAGVPLSGVAPGGPAEAAGLRRGDVVVELDGRPIENLYDFTYALEGLQVGVPARITVLRAGERLPFEVVPRSRD